MEWERSSSVYVDLYCEYVKELAISRFSLVKDLSFSSMRWRDWVSSSFFLLKSLFLSSIGLHCFSASRTRFSWERGIKKQHSSNYPFFSVTALLPCSQNNLIIKIWHTSSFLSSTRSVLRSSSFRIVEFSSATRLWFLLISCAYETANI